MKLIIIGIQGAGKSTQGNKISEKFGIPYLSSGHILRNMAKEKTPLGRYTKETINAGVLFPDKKMIKVITEYLQKPEYANGYVLDGFPRTVKQAEKFENGIDKAIFLKVSDKEAVWRLFGRLDEDVRQDNTLDALRKRIKSFHEFTMPVVDHYKRIDKLIEVDGEQDIDSIFSEISKKLNKIK